MNERSIKRPRSMKPKRKRWWRIKLLKTYLDTSQRDRVISEVQTTSHGIHHGLRLLKDLLLHEIFVVTLHDLLDLHLQSCDFSCMGIVHASTESMDTESTLFHCGYVVVLTSKKIKIYIEKLKYKIFQL